LRGASWLGGCGGRGVGVTEVAIKVQGMECGRGQCLGCDGWGGGEDWIMGDRGTEGMVLMCYDNVRYPRV